MSTRRLTVQIPQILYNQLSHRAQVSNTTVEKQLVELATTALIEADTLPAELDAELTALALLPDAALWDAAQSTLPAEAAAHLEELNAKQQREGLTGYEREMQDTLVEQYERYMLVRAQAAALLQARGHDVSVLLKKPKRK